MTDLSPLTDTDLARLRMRLDQLPGFDPVGLRVWVRHGRHQHWLCHSLFTTDYDEPRVHLTIDIRGEYADLHPDVVDLDLGDAATRDRVARWVALRLLTTHKLNVHESCTAPTFELGQVKGEGEGPGVWLLSLRPLVLGGGGPFQEFDRTTVPALEDLAWHDSRRLPDGSRWVDAAALAEVARHVGGAR